MEHTIIRTDGDSPRIGSRLHVYCGDADCVRPHPSIVLAESSYDSWLLQHPEMEGVEIPPQARFYAVAKD